MDSYVANIEIHQFEESMNITECAFETLVMASQEWAAIEESVDIDDMSLFEAEILGLKEAEENKAGFVEKLKVLGQKIIAMLKKIASYIMGVISKWLASLVALVKKDAALVKDEARVKRGAEKLVADGKDIKIYGMLSKKGARPIYGSLLGVVKSKGVFETIDQIKALSSDDVSKIKNEMNQFGNECRGILVGGGEVEAKDFKVKITEYMTGDKGTQEYVFNKGNINNALTTAMATIKGGAKEQKAAAKAAYDDVKKTIDGMIDKVKSLTVGAKAIEDKEAQSVALSAIKAIGQMYNTASSIANSANSIALGILSTDYRTNVQLVMKCWAAGVTSIKAKAEAKKAQKDAAKEFAKEGRTIDESAEVEVQEAQVEGAGEPTKKVEPTQESVESIFGMDLI